MRNNQNQMFEELVVSNTLEIRSGIRILESKGLITSDEVLKEISKLKEEMDEKISRMRELVRKIFIFVLIKIYSLDVIMSEHIEQELTISLLIQKLQRICK